MAVRVGELAISTQLLPSPPPQQDDVRQLTGVVTMSLTIPWRRRQFRCRAHLRTWLVSQVGRNSDSHMPRMKPASVSVRG
ncbi:hypothetical protein [Streptomyces sp. NPDC047453]|uniref:hypothetical protein n=1 Tax=Streptomyces sp. NPDC047453 TaxID=3154812 RepID=UPI0033F3CF3C